MKVLDVSKAQRFAVIRLDLFSRDTFPYREFAEASDALEEAAARNRERMSAADDTFHVIDADGYPLGMEL